MAPDSMASLVRAADALHRLLRPRGWGYNRRTEADADSTAWAFRFLGLVDDLRRLDRTNLAGPFPRSRGRCTHLSTRRSPLRFLGRRPRRRNARSRSGASGCCRAALVGATCTHSGSRRARRGTALARVLVDDRRLRCCPECVEFLTVTGGVPGHAVSSVRGWLASASANSGVRDCTAAGVRLCGRARAVYNTRGRTYAMPTRRRRLVIRETVLLLPQQHSSSAPRAFADIRRCLSSAMAIYALKRHLGGH